MGMLVQFPVTLGPERLRRMREERAQLMSGPSVILTCLCGASVVIYDRADISAYPFRIFHTAHKKCVPDVEYWGF